MARICAFDLSLAATGHAVLVDGRFEFSTIKPPVKDYPEGMPRLNWIYDTVLRQAAGASLVVMEDLSFGSNMPSAQERAGLAYLVRHRLWFLGAPYVLVAPTRLKKFASGKGNSEKSIVIREVFRRWGCEAKNDNEADAIVLAAIGACLKGDMQPTTDAQKEVIRDIRAVRGK